MGIADCNGVSAPTLSGDVGVLPVELIFFNVEEKSQKTILSWQTASELNNEKFEIEESQDGRAFQKIEEVEGHGTTFELQDYSYIIENPRKGLTYYRLKQVDYDGQFEYSKIISIDVKSENEKVGEFYPNPSKAGRINLDYTSQNNENVTVTVFDMTGKLIFNQIHQISRANAPKYFEIDNFSE